jgi:lipid A 3-O-deacylase
MSVTGVGGKENNRAGMLVLTVLVLLFAFLPAALQAGEQVPAVNGMSLNLGYTYDPSDNIWFSQVSIFRIHDYDSIWPHKAPEHLRFKVEGNLGGARMDNSDLRMTVSLNIFAMLYLAGDGNRRVRPYVEAGIGGIYTDYRVTGQDYRFNFNPQAGVGMELNMGGVHLCFTSLRVHHLSNGGIGASNRGQNSVVCLFGRYF